MNFCAVLEVSRRAGSQYETELIAYINSTVVCMIACRITPITTSNAPGGLERTGTFGKMVAVTSVQFTESPVDGHCSHQLYVGSLIDSSWNAYDYRTSNLPSSSIVTICRLLLS
ncbi:hypothetical protein TNCV_805411 [Trichonephila clavipes]|nr:hypothetical protein TNCV_805411 [Trichonephila clavipes]